jgi:hypothetical protein
MLPWQRGDISKLPKITICLDFFHQNIFQSAATSKAFQRWLQVTLWSTWGHFKPLTSPKFSWCSLFSNILKRKHLFGARIGHFFTISGLKKGGSKVRCFAYIWGKGLNKWYIFNLRFYTSIDRFLRRYGDMRVLSAKCTRIGNKR